MHTKVPSHSSPSRPSEPRSRAPKSFKVRRRSAQVGISGSWRIGAIPLRSIAVGFKTLASRVAQAVIRPSAAKHASESEDHLPVTLHPRDRNAARSSGTQAVGQKVVQQLEEALTHNLLAMVCGPTTETVDTTGICKAFENDVFRGTDIVDRIAKPPQALQAGLPNGEGQGDQRHAAIQTYMAQLGTARFDSDPALMEAFTKIAHQGAFKPVMEKMGALLGRCDFSTPVLNAPAVIPSTTTRQFELHAASVTRDRASLDVSMHLNASINLIADQTGSSKTFVPNTSNVSFSSRVILEIDCRQVLPPTSSDPTTDKKSAEPQGSLSGDTSSEQRYPSRLPRAAIKLTMADTRVEYRLNPSDPSES